jgi:ribosome-binding protein aMBF1 (putative translation factor)
VADIALLAGELADHAGDLVGVSKYMYFDTMPRRSLTDQEVRHGRQLGRALAQRRSALAVSAQDVATRADLSIDALRSLESGRVATPAFLTVARLADVLEVSLDEMHRVASADQTP